MHGVKDAGKPAVLNTSTAGESVALPAGSKITATETKAVPAQSATPTAPAQAAQPAQTVTVIEPAGPTEWRKTEVTVHADTGTVDTSVANRKIDAAESRPMLYAAIGAAALAAVFLWLKYPTPALISGIGAVVFFLAWKASGLPPWFWAIGVAAVVGGAALYFGHEKGELFHKQTTAAS